MCVEKRGEPISVGCGYNNEAVQEMASSIAANWGTLSAKAYGNPVPSRLREQTEGQTTMTYHLKSDDEVHTTRAKFSCWKCRAPNDVFGRRYSLVP